MRYPAIVVVMAALVLAMPACSTGADPCAGFKPIRPAIADVDAMAPGLARQIVAHNETGAELCRWTP